MSQLLEKHKIEVPEELEKLVDSPEQCQTPQFQGDIKYALNSRVKYFPHIYDIYSFSNISESEISDPFFDDPPLGLLDSSPKICDFSLDIDLSLGNSSSQYCIYDLEYCFQDDMHVMTHIIPPYIPSTIPMNTPKTIQTSSSVVDYSLVFYAVLLILHGFKYYLYFIDWLSMNLVIFGIILYMF